MVMRRSGNPKCPDGSPKVPRRFTQVTSAQLSMVPSRTAAAQKSRSHAPAGMLTDNRTMGHGGLWFRDRPVRSTATSNWIVSWSIGQTQDIERTTS